MKKTLLIALVALLAGVTAPLANAVSLNIEVGDQPYYVRGPHYWEGNAYYVWVPGHWGHHHHWVHGHYRVHHRR